MSYYYDRQGNPLTLTEWANAFEKGFDAKVVKQETLPNGRWVSTVWIGLDHRFGDGPPLIFESMVFRTKDSMEEVDSRRYSTEEEALVGHADLVERWSR